MHKYSYVLVERYYFVKQHPLGAYRDNQPPLYGFGYDQTILN